MRIPLEFVESLVSGLDIIFFAKVVSSSALRGGRHTDAGVLRRRKTLVQFTHHHGLHGVELCPQAAGQKRGKHAAEVPAHR